MKLVIDFDLSRNCDNVTKKNFYSSSINELCNEIRIEENNNLVDEQSAKINSDWGELSHQVIGFETF